MVACLSNESCMRVKLVFKYKLRIRILTLSRFNFNQLSSLFYQDMRVEKTLVDMRVNENSLQTLASQLSCKSCSRFTRTSEIEKTLIQALASQLNNSLITLVLV